MRTLASFDGVHRDGKIIVCGCGVSLNRLARPERFVTIGVNDVGRLFQPNYLVVVDPRERFQGDRFHYVETSEAAYLFTQVQDLGVPHPNIVRFRLGRKDGIDFSDPNALNYGVISPHVALCLATRMGATRIGLIGVDFTDDHFFGATGRHQWAPRLAEIEASLGRLGAALAARGVAVFNLSPDSRVTAFPPISLEAFAALPEYVPPAPFQPEIAPAAPASGAASVSVVIATLNEGEYLQRTVQSLMAGLPDDGEILVVDDGSTDRSADFLERTDERITLLRPGGRLGSPRARNFGARHARGKILVFSDAHVATPPAWATQLRAALNNPDVGAIMPAIRVMRFPDDYETVPASDNGEARGYGLAWSDAGLGVRWLARKTENAYPVPLLGAGFMAMRRTVFAAVGGFDPGLDLWGSEDAELSVRLWTLGYECLVLPGLEVAHLFRRDRPYHVDWEAVLCNKLRLASIHFAPERLERVASALADKPAFAAALGRLEASDAARRRESHRALRRHDDAWFFERFRADLPAEL